jgi:hypothetical protein
MKKSYLKKLTLSRETLRELASPSLSEAQGGAKPQETRAISICYSCTTPLDGCPDPTETVA